MKTEFPKLYGNVATKRRLAGAILSGTLPHALLIAGPEGSGKHTLAYEIAAAANCEQLNNEGSPLPCGKCNNCKRIYAKNFPDISTLSKENKATIGVEELRAFREEMFLSSTESKYKIFIIEDADLMTPAAQNALLKVLEEPPADVHIMLLAKETDKILSTIKSRTQHIRMELFDYQSLLSKVCELSEGADQMRRTSPDKLKGILLASGGIIGEALLSFESDAKDDIAKEREMIDTFISALPKKAPFSKLYLACTSLPSKRDELRRVLEIIRTALRDMIAHKVSEGIDRSYFLTAEDTEGAIGSIGTKRLLAVYDIITESIEDLDKNIVTAPLLTDIAVKIKEA